jgi:hypothetical protein
MANAFEPLGIRHFRPVRPGTFTRAFRFNSPHVLSTTSRHKPPVQWTSNLTANRWNLHHNAWYSSSLQVQSKEENRNKGEGTTSTATSASTARGTLGDSRALRNNIYTNSSHSSSSWDPDCHSRASSKVLLSPIFKPSCSSMRSRWSSAG